MGNLREIRARTPLKTLPRANQDYVTPLRERQLTRRAASTGKRLIAWRQTHANAQLDAASAI
jgi:hypothetical protein